MRICADCKTSKPLSDFGIKASSTDGLNPRCKKCHSARQIAYQKANKEKVNAKNRKWADSNRGKTRAASLSWVERNRSKVYADNSLWRKANRGLCNSYSRRYQAAKIKAMPLWLTDEHKAEITAFYVNRPEGFHVDHIIPLQGKQVKGLHVPWNLQYLTISDNCKKSNKAK